MTPQQRKYYNQLKSQLLIEAAGEEVSAVNAATKMSKLLQISCGSVYTDTGEVLEFDVSNRMNVVQEVIDESSNKVLVFVPFTHTIEMLKNHLVKNGITCDVINGAVPVNRRSQIVTDFQTSRLRRFSSSNHKRHHTGLHLLPPTQSFGTLPVPAWRLIFRPTHVLTAPVKSTQ